MVIDEEAQRARAFQKEKDALRAPFAELMN
jgi:hypothetical protein